LVSRGLVFHSSLDYSYIVHINVQTVSAKIGKKYPEPSKAVREFHYLLLALWIAWAILYSALAYRAFDTIDGRNKLLREAHNVKEGGTKNSATEVLNALREDNNRFDINEALTLAERYPRERSGGSKTFEEAVSDFKNAKNDLKSRSWEIFLNCLNNAQATIVLLLFWVLAFPRDPKKIFLIALVVIVGTFLSLLVGRYPFDGIPGVLGGLFGGVALALWVGRLDSKFLMAPPGYILVLYFYAILQATWFVFRDEDEKVLVITGLAEENAESPMYGLFTVEDRLRAFLDDIRESETSSSNEPL